MNKRWQAAMGELPLVAILRGLTEHRASRLGGVLYACGLRAIEVPLNRPGALHAIATLKRNLPSNAVVGAGTVVTPELARQAMEAGAEFLVMPNFDPIVVRTGMELGLHVVPGVMTPSEAFAAVQLGVRSLKLFPADVVGPGGLKALRSVIGKDQAEILPVGGITCESVTIWEAAGADGLGIGSALFEPAITEEELERRSHAFINAWRRTELREI